MRRIVVGIDGSDGSRRALRWAIREAADHEASIEAVFAFQYAPVWAYGPDIVMPPSETFDTSFEEATRLLERTVREVAGSDPPVPIETHVVEGGAARRLLEFAEDADLLVVGSRGFGGFKGLLLGSVSQQCIHHAKAPVVVVPEESSAA